MGTQQLLRRQIFDGKADGLRGPIKTLISGRLTSGFPIAHREQLGLRLVVENLVLRCNLINCAHYGVLPAGCRRVSKSPEFVNNMLARGAATFAFDSSKGACVVRMAIIQIRYVRTKSGKARQAVINIPESRKWASLIVMFFAKRSSTNVPPPWPRTISPVCA